MVGRVAALLIVGIGLAGCANSEPHSSPLVTPAQASEPEPDPGRKTLASKVLGALALERVTGRKPDPARLSEFN